MKQEISILVKQSEYNSFCICFYFYLISCFYLVVSIFIIFPIGTGRDQTTTCYQPGRSLMLYPYQSNDLWIFFFGWLVSFVYYLSGFSSIHTGQTSQSTPRSSTIDLPIRNSLVFCLVKRFSLIRSLSIPFSIVIPKSSFRPKRIRIRLFYSIYQSYVLAFPLHFCKFTFFLFLPFYYATSKPIV